MLWCFSIILPQTHTHKISDAVVITEDRSMSKPMFKNRGINNIFKNLKAFGIFFFPLLLPGCWVYTPPCEQIDGPQCPQSCCHRHGGSLSASCCVCVCVYWHNDSLLACGISVVTESFRAIPVPFPQQQHLLCPQIKPFKYLQHICPRSGPEGQCNPTHARMELRFSLCLILTPLFSFLVCVSSSWPLYCRLSDASPPPPPPQAVRRKAQNCSEVNGA